MRGPQIQEQRDAGPAGAGRGGSGAGGGRERRMRGRRGEGVRSGAALRAGEPWPWCLSEHVL